MTDLSFVLQLGTAMRYQVQTLYDPVFGADDPRAWRNECANPGSTARLSDILNEWKNDYAQLHMIGQTNGRGPVYADSSGEEYKVRIDFRPLRWIAGRLTIFSLGTARTDAESWLAR
jgi:hypothetical protein